MSRERQPDGELLEIKGKKQKKEESKPKPKTVNKGTNDLETN